MSKKNFIALADYIKMHNTHSDPAEHFRPGQIRTLAEFCLSQNPRFNRERFIGYVKGENGPNGGSIRK